MRSLSGAFFLDARTEVGGLGVAGRKEQENLVALRPCTIFAGIPIRRTVDC